MTDGSALSVVIVAVTEAAAELIRAEVDSLSGIASSTAISTFDGATARVAESEPDAVLIAIDDDADRALAVIEECVRRAPSTAVVALSRDARPESCIRVLRVGAAELLAMPVVAEDLSRALAKVAEVQGLTAARNEMRGEIWTVAAPKEGVGATTLVANLGFELRRAGRDVVLVDFDVRNGELALFLNLTPPYSLADLAADANRLDPIFVQGTLVRHDTGLYLLAAPAHGGSGFAMRDEDVAAVLAALRATHQYVIIDAPPAAGDLLSAALAQADRILLPTELTVPCLRAAWRTIELLSALDCRPRQLDVVATKLGARALDISLAEARSTLKVPLTATLPRDDDAAYGALNRGIALAEMNVASPLRKAIAALADELTVGRHEEPKRKGLLASLTAAFAAP
jgi:pilus assembly protein CpaE